MIITRAPFRISFSGGGSDIPSFYEKFGGAVISTSINKYIFIDIHPYFFEDRIQLKYSQTENVDHVSKIEHKIFKRVIEKYQLKGVEITSTADLPSGTGMGSSSAFTVALLQSVNAYKRIFLSKNQLANEACQIEIEDLKNPIGKQDQYASAIGGLNFIEFNQSGSVEITPIKIPGNKIKELEEKLLIFYTGDTRDTNEVLKNQHSELKKNPERKNNLSKMVQIAKKMRNELEKNNFDNFGELLDESWELKKTLSKLISTDQIDSIYKKAKNVGAIGGKILGAGNGGFLLLYCPVEKQLALRNSLNLLKEIKFEFETSGVQVIYYN